MPDENKAKEQKRSEKKVSGAADKYNPVNMAGKKAEISEDAPTENAPSKDVYNPVNMAGKKPDTREDHAKQQSNESSKKSD